MSGEFFQHLEETLRLVRSTRDSPQWQQPPFGGIQVCALFSQCSHPRLTGCWFQDVTPRVWLAFRRASLLSTCPEPELCLLTYGTCFCKMSGSSLREDTLVYKACVCWQIVSLTLCAGTVSFMQSMYVVLYYCGKATAVVPQSHSLEVPCILTMNGWHRWMVPHVQIHSPSHWKRAIMSWLCRWCYVAIFISSHQSQSGLPWTRGGRQCRRGTADGQSNSCPFSTGAWSSSPGPGWRLAFTSTS